MVILYFGIIYVMYIGQGIARKITMSFVDCYFRLILGVIILNDSAQWSDTFGRLEKTNGGCQTVGRVMQKFGKHRLAFPNFTMRFRTTST